MKKITFFLSLMLLTLCVTNAWGAVYFEDDFSNVGKGENLTVSQRTGWSSFTKCYAQGNSGLRVGSNKDGGSVTKTAMTSIEGTKDLKVTVYIAKYNANGNNFTITTTNGTIASVTGVGTLANGTLTVAPKNNAGITGVQSTANWNDDYKTEFIIKGASKSTTIKFTTNKRAILGPITIEDAPVVDAPAVDAPTFSATNANFTEAFELTISSAEGTTLKYTLDNSDPNTSSTAVTVATNIATVSIPTKSIVVKAIACSGDEVSYATVMTYCYVNTPETAYTVAEAMEVIDAGLGLENELYIKGTISKIESFNSQYGSITYWIEDEEGNEFECYSGLGLNKAKFTSKEDVEVGASVVACGVMKLFVTSSGDKIYEFNYNNYLVEYVAPVVNHTITVSANPAEAGTIEGLAEGGKYEHGATATLTATPAEGYEFVCWTEGADTVSTEAEYGFVVLADRNLVANFVEAAPEINYEEFIMSNLVVTTPAEGLEMLEASDPVNGISVMLGVYEDGTLHEDCLITFQGMELSIVSSEKVTKEYNEGVETDVYTVRVVVAFGGANMGLQLLMYATAAAEPIIINVEGATVTLTEYQISAEETAYELNMISNWVYEEDGLTYEVECLLPTFDPTKESGDYEASFFVRGEGNAFGMTEDAIVSVAKNGNQITLTGEITAYNNNVYNVTISGTLPVVEPEVIAYELNGGELPAPAVPTNEELWIAFMPYYQEYYDVVRAEQPITSVAVFLSAGMGDDATIFTSEDSDYKWLGDYIIKVTTEQSAALTTLANWKFNAQAFFNANQYTGWPKSADFTEAGKPENWGAAYEAAHAVVLPTEPVAEDYVLPTPVKEGYTFVGWYDNAEGTGEAYKVIPAGWAGTLYAIWKQGTTTALENIAVEGKAVKAIINGQLVIIKNGVQYNALGQVIR